MRQYNSKLSDEELGRLLEEEASRHPEEYAETISFSDDAIPSSKYFIRNVSGHAVDQIRKWL